MTPDHTLESEHSRSDRHQYDTTFLFLALAPEQITTGCTPTTHCSGIGTGIGIDIGVGIGIDIGIGTGTGIGTGICRLG